MFFEIKTWQIQEAKAKFSQLITALEKGDQFITYRGELIAVVVSKERYEELTTPRSSLLDFFKQAPLQEIDLDLKRRKDMPREIEL